MLHQLPNDEKLKIIFELWDDLSASNASIQLPEEVIAEAHRRRNELTANPEMAIDNEENWRTCRWLKFPHLTRVDVSTDREQLRRR